LNTLERARHAPLTLRQSQADIFGPGRRRTAPSVNGRIHFSLTLIVKRRFKLCIHDADAWSAAQARLLAQVLELA
jgi:hypothetical protein